MSYSLLIIIADVPKAFQALGCNDFNFFFHRFFLQAAQVPEWQKEIAKLSPNFNFNSNWGCVGFISNLSHHSIPTTEKVVKQRALFCVGFISNLSNHSTPPTEKVAKQHKFKQSSNQKASFTKCF